jgi:hypothetical protein
MATATTTTLLVFLAPADLNLYASVISANAESTVLELMIPSNSILGGDNNATLTVGPSAASTGTYAAQVSVPGTGEVTINCNTSMSTPTACVATGGLGGLIQVESTTIPSYNLLPVTITGGQNVLSEASTAAITQTTDIGSPFSGMSGAAGRGNSPFAAVVALLAVTVGRWLL